MPCTGCNAKCNSCQSCNKCDSCNVAGCESAQNFCNENGQFVKSRQGSFSFNSKEENDEETVEGRYYGDFSTDTLFFIKSDWLKIFDYLEKAYLAGTTSNRASKLEIITDIDYSSNEQGSWRKIEEQKDFMTADSYNKVIKALKNLSDEDGQFQGMKEVEKDDIIFGSYFKEIQDNANSLKFNMKQCNTCNTSCNSNCNGCNDCVSCNGSCNDKCNNCIGCNSCDTCQNSCEKSCQNKTADKDKK